MSAVNELVSVVIPAYNVGDYLAQAIGSVLEQNYQKVEVIVVDDGSTDHTAEVCASFGSSINYHRQENAGVSKARNRGIALARGEFLATLDGDDYWYPDKLLRQMEVFRNHLETDFVTANYHYQDETGEITASRFFQNPVIARKWSQVDSGVILFAREEFPHYISSPFGHPSTSVFRRSLVEAVGGYSERFSVGEDVHFHIRYLARARAFAVLGEPQGSYRIRKGSATRSVALRGNQQTVQMYRELLKSVVLERPEAAAALKAKLGDSRCDLVYEFLRLGRRLDALEEILAGLVGGYDSRLLKALFNVVVG